MSIKVKRFIVLVICLCLFATALYVAIRSTRGEVMTKEVVRTEVKEYMTTITETPEMKMLIADSVKSTSEQRINTLTNDIVDNVIKQYSPASITDEEISRIQLGILTSLEGNFVDSGLTEEQLKNLADTVTTSVLVSISNAYNNDNSALNELIDKRLNVYNSQIQNILSSVNVLQSQYNELKSYITSNQVTLADLALLTSKIDEMETLLGELRLQLIFHDTEIKALKKQMSALDNRLTVLSSEWETKFSILEENILKQRLDFQQDIDNIYSYTDIEIKNLGDTLIELISNSGISDASKITEINNYLENKINKVENSTTTNIDNLTNNINADVSGIHEKIDKNDISINDKVDTTSGNLQNKINTNNTDINNKVDKTKEELQSNINSNETEINNKVDDVSSELTDKINQNDTDINNKVDSVSGELKDNISENDTNINNKVDDVSDALSNKINTNNTDINNKVDNVSDALRRDIAIEVDARKLSAEEIYKDLGELDERTVASIQTTHSQLTTALLLLETKSEAELNDLDSKLTSDINLTKITLSNEIVQLNTTMSIALQEVKDNLTAELVKVVEKQLKDITDLNSSLSTMDTQLRSLIQTTKSSLDTKINTNKGLADASIKGLTDKQAQLETNLQQCFQSVADGKKLLASALATKGQSCPSDASFETIKQKILAIEQNINVSSVPGRITYEYHRHTGASTSKSGCYTVPIYHAHGGNSSSGGGCYTVPVYHIHNGNPTTGGSCYQTPIVHKHNSGCWRETRCGCRGGNWGPWKPHYLYGQVRGCGLCGHCCHHHGDQGCGAPNKYTACGYNDNQTIGYSLSCAISNSQVMSWNLGCGKSPSSITGYALGCGRSEGEIVKATIVY